MGSIRPLPNISPRRVGRADRADIELDERRSQSLTTTSVGVVTLIPLFRSAAGGGGARQAAPRQVLGENTEAELVPASQYPDINPVEIPQPKGELSQTQRKFVTIRSELSL
jgi:hypothetical protein